MARTCVITGYGINADRELAEAFRSAGSETDAVHVQDILDRPARLRDYAILAFPGGFSFGDHLGSGLVLAHAFKQHAREEIDRFVASGRLVIGVCNGFQVLVKMGLLPNLSGDWTPEVSLIHNESGLFEDSWVWVAFAKRSPCVWTEGLDPIELPIRHGEGRFVVRSAAVMKELADRGLIAATYEGRNPNGSEQAVAGITDATGRIFGLMPHPEAFVHPQSHPRWTREHVAAGAGLAIFRKGVAAVR